MDEVVILGAKGGPAVRHPDAMPPSSLLKLDGKTIVVDCGVGVIRNLVQAGVPLTDLDAVFITHLHSDHILELGPLLYTAWTTGLRKTIDVFGPVGLEAYFEGFLASMSFDHGIRIEDEGRTPIRDLFRLHAFREGPVVDLGGIDVRALRVDHPPVTECYALRFQGTRHNAVFSADTCYFPPLAEFTAGADILVHEALLSAAVDALVQRTNGGEKLRQHLHAAHTPAEDVGRIAAAAGVGTLVLNHLVPADDPDIQDADWLAELSRTWTGRTIIGKDGIRVPFHSVMQGT